MLTRIALLFSITWIMKLTEPSFSVFGKDFSGRDLILIAGGLFLLGKSTFDIHEKLEGKVDTNPRKKIKISFTNVIIQIMLLDIVFSLDSVITAVGMTTMLGVMVTAVIIAVIFMMFSSGAISRFVHRHPTIKILALSFLLLIGIMLIADGLGQHISKGYIYFAMAFSLFVETLNMKMRKRRLKPVELYESYLEKTEKRFVKG
jgi:predicted tellurium resistance membrane protein TerC